MSPGYHPGVRSSLLDRLRSRPGDQNLSTERWEAVALSYIREAGRTPCIRFSSDGELFSLCCGPSPFLSLSLFYCPLLFFTLLRRPIPAARFDGFLSSPHQSRHKMSVSGSRSATHQDATSSSLSQTLEGGSLACRQCGTSVCSLKSLVSSVSPPVRFVYAARSNPDIFVHYSPIVDLLVCIALPTAADQPLSRGYSILPETLFCFSLRRKGSIDSGRVSNFISPLDSIAMEFSAPVTPKLTTGSSLSFTFIPLSCPPPSRINVRYDRPSIQLMTSGAYTIQEVICLVCTAYLGWKMIRAHERSERWKEGKHILELEFVQELLPPPVQRGSIPEIETARRKRMRRAASIWGSRDTNYSLPFAPQMPEFTSPTWTPLVGSFA